MLCNLDNSDVRAYSQLMKAYVQNKACLNYQINTLRIRNNFRQSNSEYKDSREVVNMNKLLLKRIQEVKNIRDALKYLETKTVDLDILEKLFCMDFSDDKNLEEIDWIERNINNTEELLETSISKYEIIKEGLDEKAIVYYHNQREINKNLQKIEKIKALEEELTDYRAEIEHFKKENTEMAIRKARSSPTKRESIGCLKIYHKMSENALKLRSKLLLRDELAKIVEKAHVELENLSVKIAKDTETFHNEERELEEISKSAGKLESELHENRKKIKKLEMAIEGLHNEIGEIASNFEIEEESPLKLSLSESLDEGETVSLTNIISGFTKMKEDKESLIEENKKLKDKISKLFVAKGDSSTDLSNSRG